MPYSLLKCHQQKVSESGKLQIQKLNLQNKMYIKTIIQDQVSSLWSLKIKIKIEMDILEHFKDNNLGLRHGSFKSSAKKEITNAIKMNFQR